MAQLQRPDLAEAQSQTKLPIAIVLDGIRSLNNVGSFFRTADALGAERILLCGITGTPPHRDIRKTALGAEDSVAWSAHPNITDALSQLISDGYTICAVEQTSEPVWLPSFAPAPGSKLALVFGNEVDGVSDEALAMADLALEIPQVGMKHSLNVAIAGGIVLWHVSQQLSR